MASPYPEGFEPIEKTSYPEGFEPIPSTATAPPVKANAAVGRLAPSQLTPIQLAALQVGIGPLASTIGRQLRGKQATQVEAAAEGALEEIGKIPGALGEMGLQAAVPPPVKLLQQILENQDLLPKNSIQGFIKNLVSPAVQAPQFISESLGIEQGSERAKFREPGAAGLGEYATNFLSPIGSQSKLGTFAAKVPGELVKSLTPAPTAVDAARLVRSALKPSNAQVGQRLEKAAASSLEDIFLSNPNADKAGEMAIEGFATEVTKLRKGLGQEIGSITAQQKAPISTGEDIAIALNKRADQLEKAGQPAATVASLRNRANDFAGKNMQISDIQEATTIANRQNSGFFKKTREMANPLLADVDTMANQIISEVGGSGINTVLENLAGPRGAQLRKQWSNLRTIEDQAEKRLNQLINSAPPESQSAVASALTSLEGLGGLVALGSGLKSGIIPVVGAIAKKWSKNAEKLLKDSNDKIARVYKQFRANPPAERPPQVYSGPIPPTLEEVINLRMAQSINPETALIPPLNPVAGPILGVTPTAPTASIATPGFAPPSGAAIEAAIQRLLQEQAAERAAQQAASTVSFF